MFADPSALIRTLETAKKRVLEFGKFTAKLGATAAAAGSAAFAPIAKMFTSAVEEGADISKLASQFGTTAEQVSTLRGAFAQAGVGATDFSSAMESLAGKISNAADGNGFLLDSLQSLGTGKELMGKGIDEQFDIIAERIKSIPNAIDQMRAANELGLGSMLPALKKGKAGLDELRAAAVANGDAMSGEQAEQAMEVQKEYNRVMLAAKSTLLEVGKALLPTGASFTSIGADIRSTLSDIRTWIQSHREIIIGVTAAAGALLAGGAAIAAFGGAVSIAAPIIGGLILAVKATVAVVASLFSPLGLIVAAVAAVGIGLYLLATRTEAGQAAFAKLKTMVGEAADFIKGSWKGITDAIGAGDFSLAFSIGLKTAEVAWKGFVLKLTEGWVWFKNVFVDTWEDATGWLAKAFVSVAASIEKTLSSVLKRIVDGFNSVAGAIDESLTIKIPGLRSDAEIDNVTKGLQAEIDKITEAEKKRRGAFRAGQIADAKTALDIAKEQLETLKQQAAEAAKKADWDKIPWLEIDEDEAAPQKSAPSIAALSEAAKGTFGSSSIQQALGYGDNVGQRQLDAQIGIQAAAERTAAATEKIADKPPAKFS